MSWLVNKLGSALTSVKEAASKYRFEEQGAWDSVSGVWRVSPATVNKTGERVSVWRTTGSSSSASADVRLLKQLRHPGVVRFLDSNDGNDTTLMVTERVRPLSLVVSELDSSAIQLGVHQVLQTLSFLHTDAKLSHNALSDMSIVVPDSGLWKLASFHAAAAPPQGQDAWRKDAEALRQVLLKVVQAVPGNKKPPSSFTNLLNQARPPRHLLQSPWLKQSPAVRCVSVISQITVIAVQPAEERKKALQFLLAHMRSLPRQFRHHGVAPELLRATAQSGQEMLKDDLFWRSLFAALHDADIAVRKQFLCPLVLRQFTPDFAPSAIIVLRAAQKWAPLFDSSAVRKQVWPHVARAASSKHAQLRESSVIAMTFLAERLVPSESGPARTQEQAALSALLTPVLRKLATDSAHAVRTNCAVLLGRLMPKLSVEDRTKLALPVLARGCGDTFVPARKAALNALLNALDHMPASDVACRILPAISPLLVDNADAVRAAAFALLQRATERSFASARTALQQQQQQQRERKKQPRASPSASPRSESPTLPFQDDALRNKASKQQQAISKLFTDEGDAEAIKLAQELTSPADSSQSVSMTRPKAAPAASKQTMGSLFPPAAASGGDKYGLGSVSAPVATVSASSNNADDWFAQMQQQSTKPSAAALFNPPSSRASSQSVTSAKRTPATADPFAGLGFDTAPSALPAGTGPSMRQQQQQQRTQRQPQRQPRQQPQQQRQQQQASVDVFDFSQWQS
ncbi:MAG: hypothetical protein MHM6MM_000131 [Cercozoa sp. M6MM]